MIWEITIFENADDQEPARRGYVQAASETEAVETATQAMGNAKRADMRVVAAQVPSLPSGVVFWA